MSSRHPHHRRSIRLAGYDYTLPGAYFVTICAYQRRCVFGDVVGGEMKYNDEGHIAYIQWFRTADLREAVELFEDEFVVMPNHVHGILHIGEISVGARRRRAPIRGRFGKPATRSLGMLIRSYKSAVTYQINRMNHSPGDRVWQRNYYEHIVRDDRELVRIRRYIQQSPLRWRQDVHFSP